MRDPVKWCFLKIPWTFNEFVVNEWYHILLLEQMGLRARLGVPTTSGILMADPLKLSFSTLIIKPILIFWSDTIEQASQADLGVSILEKIIFFESSWKIVLHRPVQLDQHFSKLGTPRPDRDYVAYFLYLDLFPLPTLLQNVILILFYDLELKCWTRCDEI